MFTMIIKPGIINMQLNARFIMGRKGNGVPFFRVSNY